MRCVIHPSSHMMSMFKEFNKLLAIKNFVSNPIGQPSYYQDILYFTRCTDKYTGKIIYTVLCMLSYSSFCVLNFMLSACRTNFTVVAHFTWKVWTRLCKDMQKKAQQLNSTWLHSLVSPSAMQSTLFNHTHSFQLGMLFQYTSVLMTSCLLVIKSTYYILCVFGFPNPVFPTRSYLHASHFYLLHDFTRA